MVPVLKVLLALAQQAQGVAVAIEAVTGLMENARRQGREVTEDELKQLSLSSHTAVDALGRAIEEME